MDSVIIIPARMGSSRFPNKPIAPILGKMLLERVWKIACSVKKVSRVVIATDSEELFGKAKSFGAEVIMTRPECENGSERTWDALQQLNLKPDVVVNFQGDAVLTPPWVIEAVLDQMAQHSEIAIGTAATQLSWNDYRDFSDARRKQDLRGTFVVFGLDGNALYFSKSLIPFVREGHFGDPNKKMPFYRHIGLYAYRYLALQQYQSLKPSQLENLEKLEQLRALENGMPIRVVLVDYRGRTHGSVDEPEDLEIVKKIIQSEGELVEWS